MCLGRFLDQVEPNFESGKAAHRPLTWKVSLNLLLFLFLAGVVGPKIGRGGRGGRRRWSLLVIKVMSHGFDYFDEDEDLSADENDEYADSDDSGDN